MRNLLSTLTCVMLFSVAANAQESNYSQLRTNSWSLYGIGGISFVTGDRLYQNVDPSPDTYVAPMLGAGVTYNIRPWVRLNLGYENSKYRREQSWHQVQTDGLSYRSLEVMHHDVDLTVDFNLAQIFRHKGESGRFNLYLGTGIGGMFAYGYDYTIRTGESETVDPDLMNDNYAYTAWLKASNERVKKNAAYIPLNLSAEYDISPRFTMGIRASAKFILDHKTQLVPSTAESFGIVLRYNFVGRKHDYNSEATQARYKNSDYTYMAAQSKEIAEQNAKLSRALEAEQKSIEEIKNSLDDIKAQLKDCGAGKESIASLRQEIRDLKAQEYIIYFDLASDRIDSKGMETLDDVVKRFNSDREATMVITASCSTDGTEAYNKDLSDRRATAVRQALLAKGIRADRITDIVSLGKEGMTKDATCRRVIIDIH